MSLVLYTVRFTVGNQKLDGAPLLHVHALVDAPDGFITGQAEITQAVVPPGSSIPIKNLTGRLFENSIGPVSRLVRLEGSYNYQLPPPAIGTVELKFSAVLVIAKEAWKGGGTFIYGAHEVIDVPVVPCNKEDED